MQICSVLPLEQQLGRGTLLIDSPRMLRSFATAESTQRYSMRFPEVRGAGHFRRPQHVLGAGELWFSSIGLGTYLGQPDEAGDSAYVEAITAALRSGINLLDTAINYRHQRSERNIGAALAALTQHGELSRDEVIVCTKAGFLSFDGAVPRDPRSYFLEEYVNKKVLDPGEVAGGMHCMAPRYLENQLERSRKNLQLETIDVFYIHNPESQLGDIDRDTFRRRIEQAFAALEHARSENKIRFYGCATWNGFRVPAESRESLSLVELAGLAKQVAGNDHGFRFVQLPFNLAMPEAFAFKNQGNGLSLLEAAAELGIAVVGSATLYQGQLTRGLPQHIRAALGTESDLHSAIQFARSAPLLTTALIGMGRQQHVEANMAAAKLPLVSQSQWLKLFER